MRSKDIVPDTYYEATITGQPEPETVRVLRIQPRREAMGSGGRRLGWFEGPKVIARRFLGAGYLDVPLLPRAILREVEPPDSLLKMFRYCEEEIGPKPVRNPIPDTTEGS